LTERKGASGVNEKIAAIIAEILETDVGKLTSDTNITALENWDSLAQVRIIAELESAFDCSIPIEKVKVLKTVKCFTEAFGATEVS
jgi:acyl carrier protein